VSYLKANPTFFLHRTCPPHSFLHSPPARLNLTHPPPLVMRMEGGSEGEGPKVVECRHDSQYIFFIPLSTAKDAKLKQPCLCELCGLCSEVFKSHHNIFPAPNIPPFFLAHSSRPPEFHLSAPSCDEDGGWGRRRGEEGGGVPPWLLEYIINVVLATSNLCKSASKK